MLGLLRRKGQRVRMRLPDGREIWVGVTDVDRGTVYLAFDAPPDVRIVREELLDQSEKAGKG